MIVGNSRMPGTLRLGDALERYGESRRQAVVQMSPPRVARSIGGREQEARLTADLLRQSDRPDRKCLVSLRKVREVCVGG